MLKIYYSKMTEKFSRNASYYFSFLPKIFRDQIIKFKFQKDINFKLLGKILLKKALEKEGYLNEFDKIKLSKDKKPYLETNIEFNISYSYPLVVCVIDTSPIGIDVEKIVPFDFNNLEYLFNKGDRLYLKNNKYSQAAFFDLWTKKEAISKADGRGLTIPLNDIVINYEVHPFRGLISENFKNKNLSNDNKKVHWFLKKLILFDEYIINIASIKQIYNIKIISL